MTDLVVTDINELDAELVEQSQEEFTAMLQARYPELDLRRGVIHDVVAFLGGGVAFHLRAAEVALGDAPAAIAPGFGNARDGGLAGVEQFE